MRSEPRTESARHSSSIVPRAGFVSLQPLARSLQSTVHRQQLFRRDRVHVAALSSTVQPESFDSPRPKSPRHWCHLASSRLPRATQSAFERRFLGTFGSA